MRVLCLGMATVLLTTTCSALADSTWLESGRLRMSEVKDLCDGVSGVRLLARMQMISSGNDRWRQLSRQELTVETTVMGVPPLDPTRCYVIARRLGAPEERRAFEVRDFSVNAESTLIFVLGRAYDQPPGEAVLGARGHQSNP